MPYMEGHYGPEQVPFQLGSQDGMLVAGMMCRMLVFVQAVASEGLRQ